MYSYGTLTYGRAKAGRPAWTYMQELCEDTGCSSKDLPEAMNYREKWWERVMDICASGTTWWWWWWTKNGWYAVKHNQPTNILFLGKYDYLCPFFFLIDVFILFYCIYLRLHVIITVYLSCDTDERTFEVASSWERRHWVV